MSAVRKPTRIGSRGSSTSSSSDSDTSGKSRPRRRCQSLPLLLTATLLAVGWSRVKSFTPPASTTTTTRTTANLFLSSSSSSLSSSHQQHRRAPSTHLFAGGGSGCVKKKSRKRILKPRLGLLTFDLDDTLFPTHAVVQHANVRMIEYMAELGYSTTLDDYHAAARTIRQQFKHRDEAISYTNLRKRAIDMELHRITGSPNHHGDDSLHAELVDDVYARWEHERHAAAEYYLSPVVVDTLQSIRRHFGETSLCIAAITNGKGNPLHMPSLRQFFSFCVSGEDDDVFPNRKPHAKIYEMALERYRNEYHSPSDNERVNDKGQEEPILWVHVGDCLAHDVGASADSGAFAVWYCPNPEVVQASFVAAAEAAASAAANNPKNAGGASASSSSTSPLLDDSSSTNASNKRISKRIAAQLFVPPQPSWSTATQDDLMHRNELAIEAYQEKVGAHIYHLSQLLDVLKKVARPDRQASLQRRRRM